MDLKTVTVEPMQKATLEQVLATIPQQSLSRLDEKVSDIHLEEIARKLIKWESVCTNLGINEADEEAIKEENPTTDARRRAVLRRWRSKYCPTATYRNLADCFCSADMAEMVEAVCQTLRAPSSSAMGQQQGIYHLFLQLDINSTVTWFFSKSFLNSPSVLENT